MYIFILNVFVLFSNHVTQIPWIFNITWSAYYIKQYNQIIALTIQKENEEESK